MTLRAVLGLPQEKWTAADAEWLAYFADEAVPLLPGVQQRELVAHRMVDRFGDSPEDVQMAKAGKVRAIAVRGSYPNVRALEAAAPDLITDDLGRAVEWAVTSS